MANGLLGDIFGGGGSGLEGYLTADQQEAINRNAGLSAAAALLAASGARPVGQGINLGQALGGALQAGQQGYMQAQQGAIANLMARQKLDEAQREKQLQQYLLGGQPVTTTSAAPTIQTEQTAGMQIPAQVSTQPTPQSVGGNVFSRLTPEQRVLAAMSPKTMIPEIMKEELKRDSFNILTPTKVAEMGLPAEGTYQQNTRTGQITPVSSPEANPTEIRLLKAAGMPVNMQNIMAIRRAGAVTVNMGEGQKGFENEVNLKKMFSGEPIYKDYSDMQSAFKQVKSSLAQENPIGDVAAATKIMKLLDPGSVVRESELGIAMAATGKMDRLQNYVQNWTSGTKLTPTQRQDFQNLANELYAAAGQIYNQKRNEYVDFASKYNLDPTKALGAPATIPSVMKGSGSIANAGGQQRKPLGAIFAPQ